ncbi:MAG: SUMF1/EgtB/PvdO family nonheme iron enzyme [Planctomycetota bacterium]
MNRHASSSRRWVSLGIALLPVLLFSPRAQGDFVRGDANGDAIVNLSDPIQVLSYLFGGGSGTCLDGADASDDGAVNLLDPILTLAYLFTGGPPLPAPFPGCGTDPTTDGLDCALAPIACGSSYPGLTLVGKNPQGYLEYTLDLDPSVVLILIPGGTFAMGQELTNGQPVHAVTLSPYFLAKYEITNAQYRTFCDATLTPYPPSPNCCGLPLDHFTNPNYADHPVVMVSWNELTSSRGYLDWAGLVLPTEAQWEFAARGVEGRSYPWGEDSPAVGSVYRANGCWGYDCGSSDGWVYTSPVNASPFDQYPGPHGTLGQAGNVWEWCHDWLELYGPDPETDPVGPAVGTARAIRGGGWFLFAFHLQSANRYSFSPNTRHTYVGLRPARPFP